MYNVLIMVGKKKTTVKDTENKTVVEEKKEEPKYVTISNKMTNIELVAITESHKKNKKLVAVFYGPNMRGCTMIHFGSKSGKSFIDHRDEKKRKAWLARHSTKSKFDDPMDATTLSRWVLWDRETLDDSIVSFRMRFDLDKKSM